MTQTAGIARLRNQGAHRRARQSGSALIETAILTPFVLLVVCGAMDFSRVVYAGIAMASAARAGVQYGGFNPGKSGDFPGMEQAAMNDASDQGLSGVTVRARNFCACVGNSSEVSCSTGTCGGAVPCGYVETTASYTFNTLVNLPSLPHTITVSRTARMRVQ